MKQISALFAFSLAMLLAPLAHAQFLPGAQPGGPDSNQSAMIDRIVAVVGDNAILQSQLDQAVNSVKRQYAAKPQKLPPVDVLHRQVLNRLILMRLQVQKANQQGIRVGRNEVANAIANIASNNGMTSRQMRQTITNEGGSFAVFRRHVANQILVQKLRNKVVKDKVQITDAEINNLLDDPSFNAAQVHLAHIEFPLPTGAGPDDIAQAKAKAEKAEKAIANGMKFSAAAIRFSGAQDALDGGDLGWRSMNAIPPAFADLVAKMQPGEVSPPLRGPTGFHILKLIDRRKAERKVVTQYHARQILIQPSELVTQGEAKQKIQDIYKKLTEKDKDFSKLAKELSDDDTSANIGGDLGWFQLKAHGPAVAQVLQKLDKGDVSQPFRTRAGWDIIKLIDTRQSDITDKMRRQRARGIIGNRKARQVYDDYLRQMRSSSYVSIRIPSLRDPSKQDNDS